MFILRSLIWLSILVLLLPPSEDRTEPAPRVSLLHTAYAVRVIMQDVTGVCERNQDACSASRDALALLTRKIETGASIVTASVKAGQDFAQQPSTRPDADHGTLTAADLEPTWSVAEIAQ
jgi:methanogenic corrinoid protein MtbC1